MEVRIGVLHTAREIELDLGDGVDADKLAKEIETAIAGGEGMVWLTDRRGRRVGVPAQRLAYVEIGSSGDRRVGFGTH